MGNKDPVQQGALYLVALEALSAEVSQVASKSLKPINDKKLFSDLKK